MKAISNSLALVLSLFLGVSIGCQTAYAGTAGLIPAVKSGFYYQMGGGDDVPLPAFYDTSYIPLSVDSDVGLGFDCGAFNPLA